MSFQKISSPSLLFSFLASIKMYIPDNSVRFHQLGYSFHNKKIVSYPNPLRITQAMTTSISPLFPGICECWWYKKKEESGRIAHTFLFSRKIILKTWKTVWLCLHLQKGGFFARERITEKEIFLKCTSLIYSHYPAFNVLIRRIISAERKKNFV